MAARVRADLPAGVLQAAKLVPGERLQLVLVLGAEPAVDPGPRHRAATREVGRHEDRSGQPEPAQDRQRQLERGAVAVVEGDGEDAAGRPVRRTASANVRPA